MTAKEVAEKYASSPSEAEALELDILRLLESSRTIPKWLLECDHAWVDYPMFNPYGSGTGGQYTSSAYRMCTKCGRIEEKWKVTYTTQ